MRAMKDSGVEWIEDIPESWELTKIGTVYDERNEKVSDQDYAPLSVTKQGIVPQLETAAKTDNGDNRKLIRKNDFVINSRSDRRGSCGISELDGSCSLINTVLRPRRNMCNRYYGYVFKSEMFADEYYRWGHGIVDDLWSTKWSDMKSIYIPMPALSEQERIADYLADKCAKIDAIIEKQQAIIEKLKEYKLSVITEAVTKGLNPDVEMKDSGTKWYPVISKDYEIKRLKFICSKIADGTHFSPETVDEGYSYITAGDVRGKGINYLETKKVGKEAYLELVKQGCKPEKGDVLIVKDGATTGRVGLMTDNEECVILSSVAMLHPEKDSDSRYLMYLMMSNGMQQQIFLSMAGSAMPRTTLTKLMEYSGVCPPYSDQIEIANYLDKKTNNIDKVIDYKQSTINKLQEYKKSLIYEVVTGKKEV